MKFLFVLLAVSLTAVLAAAGAMWWRFSRHLRRSDRALKNALGEIQAERESVKQNS
ncbi:MAG TPA: hypothetical protein VN176_16865 [Verrucomicrobiae bacterium]|jgi:hypothetical protein|nr:hypothetical protein [Verrucomicrobiae bacterium]